MRISEEIKAEISTIPEEDIKGFINWLLEFEKEFLLNTSALYKGRIEKAILTYLNEVEDNSAKN